MVDTVNERAVLERILEEASRRGLSQRDLAEQAGLTPEGLSRLKKRGYGRLDTVEKLAGLVGLKIAAIPAGQAAKKTARRTGRPASAATFRGRHPDLVWSNSKATDEVFVQRALLDPRFDVLLDAAKAFGPSKVEDQWHALVATQSAEVRRAAPTTERMLRHIRRGYELATR